MNKVEILFANKAINRAGIFLYSKEDALQFVNACRETSTMILGIDAFFITHNTTEPSMENSIDFSKHSFTKDIYDEAIRFLTMRDDRLFFEIVCPD
jgi:hypothetical protein